MNPLKKLLIASCSLMLLACSQGSQVSPESRETPMADVQKPVVYQIFTRLFGNTEETLVPWGTLEQNGVGKFNDITDTALIALRDMGVTHVWYTGVPHHAMIGDYREFGIDQDDPDVVKGRAGSPYAVKDYYDVNPDLAVNPAQRLEEFQALIARSHSHGLKVIIDIVPNHVARHYRSTAKPAGVEDFGAGDDTSVEYARHNNFYYVPGEAFQVPDIPHDFRPLGGAEHPLSDGQFAENPAKWTGNGARAAQPDFNDWYETVKINYGVRPDGSYDFPRLPEGYDQQPASAHAAFWAQQDVPDSWKKFRDIAHYWLAMGVDGFRYDMAEMVPVEFWSYLNAGILQQYPDAFLLAEIYNPVEYRPYIFSGKMGYLYDKVGLYDTLRGIIEGRQSTDDIAAARNDVADISEHMLNFLENHDEQRIASAQFAGAAERGIPAMVVSATLNKAPVMIYFGQEVGEPAGSDAGFGSKSRTTIFDYAGVPAHQAWMNHGAFDGGLLSAGQKALREQYRQLLRFTVGASALRGEFFDLHQVNVDEGRNYRSPLFSFARWDDHQRLIVVANFSEASSPEFTLVLPAALIEAWQLGDGDYDLVDQLGADKPVRLRVKSGQGSVTATLAADEAVILQVPVVR